MASGFLITMKRINEMDARSHRNGTTLEKTLELTAAPGLHARPAARLSAMAKKAEHRVWIEANGERVDATSTLDILSLGCSQGTRIRVCIEAPSDANVLDEMIAFIIQDFPQETQLEFQKHTEHA